ncbi:GDSL-type esterase/lipase family protein [Thiomicrorhabdus sp. 6S3-12]|uniref:GDSL-type esterase/lipase family protein n=1 Tax=Thiomicrorhabdus sp. 6S3-12 TaxID=2819681 RepID=UPI001AAC837B|nr:GDSL-type esterase/lipase family protein [Thiomicrorhabdus sp. 6S3-12]MBO1924113.1 arylesterase [Thiomicrorhabdus sp. 6S3-12]
MPQSLLSLNRLKTVLLFLLLITLLNGCSKPHQALSENAVILAFGDSLTEGYGVPESASYPTVLQTLSGHEVVNAGVSGETTDQGLLRLQQLLAERQFDLVILFEGGNDILQKRSYAQIEANLRKMIELLQAKKIQILLIGVPEKRLFSDSAPFYEKLAEHYDIPLEDEIVGDLVMRPSMKSDYVHLNRQGYQALAEAVYRKLKATGALAD